MSKQGSIPTLLYISSSRDSFEIWLCMSKVIRTLPQTSLFYAANVEDGFRQMNSRQIDIVVLDLETEEYSQHDDFVENLQGNWPPVIVHSSTKIVKPSSKSNIYYLGPCETLDGVHKSLIVAHSLIGKSANIQPDPIETH